MISRARHTARFSPVFLEDWELPMVGVRSALVAKYGIIGWCSHVGREGERGSVTVMGSASRSG